MKKKQHSRRSFLIRTGTTIIGSTFLPEFLLTKSFFQKSEWISEPDMPFKLQEIYCAKVKNRIHVAGGFIDMDGTLGVSNHYLIFDPDANTWNHGTPLPEPRHHPQLVSCADKLYVIGGYTAESGRNSWIAQSQLWVYQENENTWQTLQSAPKKNGESVSASIENRIHIVGGRHPRGMTNKTYQDKEDVDTHLIYFPSSNTWEFGAPALSKRNSAAGALIKGLLYVTGGRNMQTGNVTDLEIYDPKEDKWRKGAPMPQGQGGLAAAALRGKLYAFGGEFFDNGSGVYSECWCYDPIKDLWSASVPMKTPRHGLCATTLNGRIYAIGGAKKASARETSGTMESITYP